MHGMRQCATVARAIPKVSLLCDANDRFVLNWKIWVLSVTARRSDGFQKLAQKSEQKRKKWKIRNRAVRSRMPPLSRAKKQTMVARTKLQVIAQTRINTIGLRDDDNKREQRKDDTLQCGDESRILHLGEYCIE